MNQLRRTFLKSTGAAGTVALAVAAGLLKPGQVLAAEWNKSAFEAKNIADAMKGVNAAGAAKSADILIKAPEIAENGAVVPVEVTSKIAATSDIVIFVDENVNPMIADFTFSNGAEGYVSTRIKMAKTSNVTVVVKAGGKSYMASKEVKVTIGGCGG
ncbi:MAG: thiosulfate oxidation carrier protein SoxY [Gammaproteobacteria bacterium]|nr:thiosulfate oxidation carrier protein SoxY [Gammaproteobacteria bacterium]MBU1732609.1 thiosulfate oxidation carrier protein SoxY [Gammaproteobacteria bacterium]MBU1893472.1 thiosulfate oxidation carrier protein SoxY [Gammaproteobacteria bacterium]